MLNLLKNLYDKAEELEGKRLVVTLALTFIAFLAIGFGTNYLINQILRSPEISEELENRGKPKTENFMEGVITFIDPQNYPQDDVSFFLADETGKELILLKANDQKLEVSEGFRVKVTGSIVQTKDNKKNIMIVDKVSVINN